MSGWGQQGQGGWGQQGHQGHHGQQQGGWGQQGQQGQGGWGQQGQQGQGGWGQQGQQGQQGSWGQQGQQQGNWGQQVQGGAFNPNQDYLILTALDPNKALDVSQGNNSSKFKMLIWTKHGQKNQRFRFRQVGNGTYQILSLLGGTVEVPNGSTGNAQILVSQPNNTQN